MKTIIVIPARLESSRLPRKLLLNETGKSVLQHTFERASLSKMADLVVVACDHAEIEAEVKQFGGEAMMTRPDHVCGTDRVAEAASHYEADVIINVQGGRARDRTDGDRPADRTVATLSNGACSNFGHSDSKSRRFGKSGLCENCF